MIQLPTGNPEGRYLAVPHSSFALYATLDRTPIVRLEYVDGMRLPPSCHWQIHAERGALSHLLALSRRPRPHMLSGLHFPVAVHVSDRVWKTFYSLSSRSVGLTA